MQRTARTRNTTLNDTSLFFQRADKGATAKRARYHSSAIDVESLRPKEDFEQLPITYVIFITESDVRGEGRVLYNFEWRDTETGKPLGDGSHIIYVNAAYHAEGDSSELARLMHDFRCSNPSEMNYELLAEKARFFKETEEGVSHMCKLNEEMRNETATEAAMLEKIQIALNLLSLEAMSYEDIAAATGLTLEDVKELAEQKA